MDNKVVEIVNLVVVTVNRRRVTEEAAMAEAAGAASEEAAGAAAAGAGRPATAAAAGVAAAGVAAAGTAAASVAAAGVAAAGTAAAGAAEPVGGVAETPGFELPLRLLLAFRVLIDELHAELARRGHPDMRPMHGFVFQAIGPGGTTAAELGRRLGISKQAAGKTIDTLEQLGYTERGPDPGDARRKVVRLTDRAIDALTLSAHIFDDLRARWAEILGIERLRALEADLRLVTPLDPWRLDVPGWFGGQ
jgi:DNA-binding MarR family transcriptional regulator